MCLDSPCYSTDTEAARYPPQHILSGLRCQQVRSSNWAFASDLVFPSLECKPATLHLPLCSSLHSCNRFVSLPDGVYGCPWTAAGSLLHRAPYWEQAQKRTSAPIIDGNIFMQISLIGNLWCSQTRSPSNDKSNQVKSSRLHSQRNSTAPTIIEDIIYCTANTTPFSITIELQAIKLPLLYCKTSGTIRNAGGYCHVDMEIWYWQMLWNAVEQNILLFNYIDVLLASWPLRVTGVN